MVRSSWLRLIRRRLAFVPTTPAFRCRPFLEALEDRTLPSITINTGGALIPAWTSEGPQGIANAGNVIGGTAGPFKLPAIDDGGISSIAVDPNNPNHVAVGTVNGGVWVTSNNILAPDWSTTTDQLPSLAIGDVAFSPVLPNVLYAGTGSYSAFGGSVQGAGQGGGAVGVYRSADGGQTWTVLGNTPDLFDGLRIRRIVPTAINGGQTIFAGTTDTGFDTRGNPTGGVYRSDDQGVTWKLLSGANDGLPAGGVTELIADPSNPNVVYTALEGAPGVAGVYKLDTTGGNTTWTNITGNLGILGAFGVNNPQVLMSISKAGVHPIYLAAVNPSGYLQGVYRLDPTGGNTTWKPIGPGGAPPALYGEYNPTTGQGAQGSLHLSIVADPNQDNLVYVGGDSQAASPFAGNIARGDATLNTWTAVVAQTSTAVQPGTVAPTVDPTNPATTSPHADSRRMVFDGNNILEADDGGIYLLQAPQGKDSTGNPTAPLWTSINDNLADTEFFQVGVDPATGTLLGAAQDNGTSVGTFSLTNGSFSWSEAIGGDGTSVLVDSTRSLRYFVDDNFFLGSGPTGTSTPVAAIKGAPGLTLNPREAGIPGSGFTTIKPALPFATAVELNPVGDMLVGGNQTLYLSIDQAASFRSLGGLNPTATAALPVPALGIPGGVITGTITSIAFGNGSNNNLAYVGDSSGNIYVSTNVESLATNPLATTDFSAVAGGASPLDIVIDPSNGNLAYAVTANGVFETTNGQNWTPITGNLTKLTDSGGVTTLASIALVKSVTPTSDELLVGGLGGVFRLAVNPSGPPPAVPFWTRYGTSLPNVLVTSLDYNAAANLLVAGTFGRGAWEISTAGGTLGDAITLTVAGGGVPSFQANPNDPLQFIVSDGLGTTQTLDLALFSQITVGGPNGEGPLTVDDSADPLGSTYTITASSVQVNGFAPIGYSGVTSVTVNGGLGSNTFNVLSTAAGSPVHLNTGSGSSTVTITSAAVPLSPEVVLGPKITPQASSFNTLQGDVFVNGSTASNPAGGVGNALLTIDDSADTANTTYTLSEFGLLTSQVQLSNSATIHYQNFDVVSLNVKGGSGTDLFNVASSFPLSSLITLATGSGSNIVNIPAVPGPVLIAGSVLVQGGSGSTQLNVNYQGDGSTGNVYTVTRNSVGGGTPDLAPILYVGIQGVTLNGGGQANTYNIQSTVAGNPVVVKGTGNDSFNVTHSSSTGVKTLGANVTIFGGSGTNSLRIIDKGNPSTPVGVTSAGQVIIGDPITISYSNIQGVTLDGPVSGAYDIAGIPQGTALTINLGTGPNTFNVAPGAQGSLTLNGGGTAPLTFDDSTDTANATYTITPTTVQVNGSAPISYVGAQSLSVTGGSGTDIFNVEGTADATPVTLITGSGSSTVNVTPTSMDLGNLGTILTVQGGTGTTTLIVDDQADPVAPNIYTITRSSIASLFAAPILFSGIQDVTLNGGGSSATYDLLSSGPNTPVFLDGGPGNDTFNVGSRANTLDPIQGPVSVNGGGGSDRLYLFDQGQTVGQAYTLTPTSLARPGVGPINFGIGLLRFGSQPGTGAKPAIGTISLPSLQAVLDAGSGNDTLAVTVPPPFIVIGDGNGGTTVTEPNAVKPTFVGIIASTPFTFNGGSGTNTVLGPAAVNTWQLTGSNSGTLGSLPSSSLGNLPSAAINFLPSAAINLTFNSVQNVTGGSVSDTFQISKGGRVSGTIDGGSGLATLDYSQYGTGVVVNLATGTAPGAASVRDIHTVMGTPYNDSLTGNLHADTTLYGNGGADKLQGGGDGRETYVLNAQQFGTVVTGGTGSDTLVGPNLPTLWALTGSNAGTVYGVITISFSPFGSSHGGSTSIEALYGIAAFSHIANLTGGTGTDTFEFQKGGNVTGAIDGGSGSNKLDYTFFPGNVTVNLQTKAATATGGITNIQTLAGNGAGTTLIGPDAPSTWTLTGTNAGTVAGLTFSAVANLTGGGGADTFLLSSFEVSGNIDGGGGVNTLNYSGFRGTILVDLPLGLATLVGGKVSHIQNVSGGSGNAILVGDGSGNTLTGGKGRNLLIAGPRPATLIGGSDQDILIGGTTSYDTNVTALDALMAEWSRTDLPYATRVNHLLHGGGLNGVNLLNSSTVHSNGGGNTLTGGAGLDLFFGSLALDSSDWNANLGEVFVALTQPAIQTNPNR